MSFRVCRRDELQPGECGVFTVDGREFAVARVSEDEFYAIRNRCPHQGAPLGRGYLTGTFLPSEVGQYDYGREAEILRCPWHRYEFDVTTGRSLHDPAHCRVAAYRVVLQGDEVLLE
jgi:nitrite reductase (NADH) small subunit